MCVSPVRTGPLSTAPDGTPARRPQVHAAFCDGAPEAEHPRKRRLAFSMRALDDEGMPLEGGEFCSATALMVIPKGGMEALRARASETPRFEVPG